MFRAGINIIGPKKVRLVHRVDRNGHGWPSRLIEVEEGVYLLRDLAVIGH